jgi:hypothetical protein
MSGKLVIIILLIALLEGGDCFTQTVQPQADSQFSILNITNQKYPRMDYNLREFALFLKD